MRYLLLTFSLLSSFCLTASAATITVTSLSDSCPAITPTPTPPVTTSRPANRPGNTGPGCDIGIYPVEDYVPRSGGTFNFSIADWEECGWSISSPEWIAPSQYSGYGNFNGVYTVQPTNPGEPRVGVINVSGAYYQVTLTVHQAGFDPTPTPTPTPRVLTVANTNDNGPGSLRQAIADVTPIDTINFDPSVFGTPQTITLTSGQIVIDKNLTLPGPGANLLTISGNNASRVFSINRNATATLQGMTITDGSAVLGGGIYNAGTLIVSACTVAGNAATELGGGIFIGSGTATIANSTISGNAAQYGGGIYNNTNTLTVVNSTVSGNNASTGSGICNAGTLTASNSTVSGNSGASGGIHSFGGSSETLTNTIVANNAGGDISGIIETASHNLIADANSSGGIQNGVNGNIVGANPLLGTLQNNGGPTWTHALLPGSPAVNSGDNCVLIANGCGYTHPALPADQRGMPRRGNVDMGSFEFYSGPIPCTNCRLM